MNTQSCKQRISKELDSRMDDLTRLWTAYCDGDDDRHADDIGTFTEYGLSFDYVSPDTFDNQSEGYFRYQISWGGPSDEFRFFINPDFSCHRIEYWFMDWFDGDCRVLNGDDEFLLQEIWRWFTEVSDLPGLLKTD